MGFDWSGSVVVEYGVRVKIPACVARFAKRLSHFRPVAPSLFASTAKTLAEVGSLDAVGQLPEQIAKRAREEARPLPADDDGASRMNGSDAGSEECAFSDVPSDMGADERAVYEPIKETCHNSYDTDCTFDLEYNDPELINDAFNHAVNKLLGDDHDLELVHEANGGAYGNCDEGTLEKALRIRVGSSVCAHDGCLSAPRGGISGVPWGVAVVALPLEKDMTEVRKQIERVLEAFGLTAEDEIGWRLVTVASGG